MRRKVALAAVVIVAVVGFGAWWFLFRDDAPPEADIDEAAQTLEDEASDGSVVAEGDDLSGTWAVDPSVGSFTDFTSSYVGYRVQEELGSIGANTAVGRTPDVSGEVQVDGSSVTEGTIEVDLTTLQSDESVRDGQMRTQGLETNQFPDASFTLTEPLALPVEGEAVSLTAIGELTLHGVTQPVEVPLEVVLEGDQVAVTGQVPVTMADYDIDPPSSFLVLSIEDHGVLELQLFLTKQ